MARPDRKATAKLLAAKGLSTRDISKITGWHHSTIAEDLKALKAVQNRTEDVQNRTAATGGEETKQHREEVAEAAAPTVRPRANAAARIRRARLQRPQACLRRICRLAHQ